MPSTLQTLINAIPTAHDGDVISSDSHNSVRTAVAALAAQFDSLAGGGTDTVITFSPTFFPVFVTGVKQAEWIPSVGIASRAPGASDADGWFPLQLPNQARINNLAVIGQKTGTVPLSLRVWMLRSAIANPSNIQMININLKLTTGEPFQVTGDVTIAGVSPSVVEEYRRVDNSAYQYFIEAKLVGAAVDTQVEFFAFQVSCSTASSIS